MNRVIVFAAAVAAAPLPAFAQAVATPSPDGLCSASTPAEYYERLFAEQERAAEAGEKASEAEKAALYAAHAEGLAKAKAAADAHRKANPPPKGIQAFVQDTTDIRPGDTPQENEIDVEFSVEYRAPRFKFLLVREARFGPDGQLISDGLTPIGKVWAKADPYAKEVGGASCQPVLGADAAGNTYVSEVIVLGPGDRGGQKIERAHLWFNAQGEVYRGAKYNSAGGNAGGFDEPRNYPAQGLEAEPVAMVEVPRAVTLACTECQALADRRNEIVAKAAPLARTVNERAAEYNRSLAVYRQSRDAQLTSPDETVRLSARTQVYKDLINMRRTYERDRKPYDAAMAELGAADAAYMACERRCRPPAPAAAESAGVAGGATTGGETRLQASVGYQWTKLPGLAFLGRETPGATAPTLGLFESEREVSGAIYGLDFSFSAGGETDSGLRFEGRLRYTEAESRATFGRTDLAGDRLVIPGLGEGPNGNGFVFNYFNGLNAPDGAEVSRDFVSTEAEIGMIFEPMTVSDRVRWAYGIWGGYEAQEHEADFFAPVPGFARDIAYEQRIDVDAFKLGASLGLEYDLDETVTLGFQLRGSVIFADFEGTNRLTFTGFAPQLVSDEDSQTSFDGDFSAYLDADIGANASIVIAADGFYSSGTPVWRTPGGGARATIETEDSAGFVLSTYFRLEW